MRRSCDEFMRRREEPHRFTQKRPQTAVSVLQMLQRRSAPSSCGLLRQSIIKRWHHKQMRTFYGSSAVLKSPRDCTMLGSSIRRVGLIDITVGNATRLGASQRSATRRCASHHIATQRLSRWGSPAARARLARTLPPSPVAPDAYRSQPEAETEEILPRGRELDPRHSTRRLTSAGLTVVGANRLEASVQGPWTSWDLQTRQRSQVPDCRQRIQTYASRRPGRVLARC